MSRSSPITVTQDLLEKIVYELRSRICCSIDVARGSGSEHERYSHLFFREPVSDEVNAYISMSDSIRSKAGETYQLLQSSRVYRFSYQVSTVYGAIVRFGVGECGECVSEFIFQFQQSLDLLRQGYLLNFAVQDPNLKNRMHNFLIYVLRTRQLPALPTKNCNFSGWLNSVDSEIRNEMILVDPWRNVVEPLTLTATEHLIACINGDHLDQVYAAAKHFEQYSEQDSTLTTKITEEIDFLYKRMCLIPTIATYFMNERKKASGNTVLVSILNQRCPGLTFFATVRRGYLTDAVAEIHSNEQHKQAVQLIVSLRSGQIIKTLNGEKYYVLEGINVPEKYSESLGSKIQKL